MARRRKNVPQSGTGIPPALLEAAARRFRALSSASRLRILNALMDGGLTVGALVAATGLEQSNLSRQVAELEQEGLVSRTRDGRHVLVAITDPTLRQLCEVVCGALRQEAAGELRAR